MGDLDKFVHRKDTYEKIVVNPIESDKREKPEGYTSLKTSTRSQVLATLLSYFKKILNTLSAKGKRQPLAVDQEQILEHVRAFKALLEVLCEIDHSHHPDFTVQLAEVWHQLIDDNNALRPVSEASNALMSKIKFFISQVQHYPPGADHTLGYYFTEYAGKDWIPFPFMELLQKLHEEHQASREKSTLTSWLQLLNDILSPPGL